MTWNQGKKLTPETAIKKQVKAYLTLKGWLVLYFLAGLGAMPGMPDLCAVRKGRHVWIEVKTARGRQSRNQRQMQGFLESRGAEYRVVRGLEDVGDL
jgi:hypothetical protein